ncbi:MAG: hypothetical protein WBH44_03270 [Proteocatella sp.]
MKKIERRNWFIITVLALLIIFTSTFYIASFNVYGEITALNAQSNNKAANEYEASLVEGKYETCSYGDFDSEKSRRGIFAVSNIIMIIIIMTINAIGRKLKEKGISGNNEVYMFHARYFNVFKVILIALYIIALYLIVLK